MSPSEPAGTSLLRLTPLPFLLALALPLGLMAQEPQDTIPRPDTLPVDTAQVADTLVGDTLQVADTLVGDTLQVADTLVGDTLPVDTAQVADTLMGDSLQVADSLTEPSQEVTVDTIPVYNLPRLPAGPPTGIETAVWTWDAQAIMGERDLTLLEFLDRIPGLLPLRGGDYGAPETVTALGLGGGRIRLFLDGFEVLPLQGGVPDLALVGLGGLEEIKVERGPGELRIHLISAEVKESRPFSMVEAGTGDLATNFFRGTFLHPRALGGSLGGVLERIDTRGTDGRETGSRLGMWLRYGRYLNENMGVVAELRRSRHDVAVDAFPVQLQRSDWVIRARGRFLEDRLTAELFTGSSRLETGDELTLVPVMRSRSQRGLRVSLEEGPLWIRGALRLFGGKDLPSRSLEVESGGELPSLGGVYGRWSSDEWAGASAGAVTLHAWTRPVFGLVGFASLADGVRGWRIFPPYQEAEAPVEGEPTVTPDPEAWAYGLTDARNLRVGGSYRWRSIQVSGAWLSTEVSSLPPLGLELDRGGPPGEGGTFSGWEANARLELPVEGFALTGAYQSWGEEARYLPPRIYQGGLEFHNVFKESRNLELWGALGVEGRDPMLVPVPASGQEEASLQKVPFFQSWNVDFQVRILTMHAFIRWDNFTLRDQLQDFPGRRIPTTRTVYGIKWILWN